MREEGPFLCLTAGCSSTKNWRTVLKAKLFKTWHSGVPPVCSCPCSVAVKLCCQPTCQWHHSNFIFEGLKCVKYQVFSLWKIWWPSARRSVGTVLLYVLSDAGRKGVYPRHIISLPCVFPHCWMGTAKEWQEQWISHFELTKRSFEINS